MERNIQETKRPGNESSRERNVQNLCFVPRNVLGTKSPVTIICINALQYAPMCLLVVSITATYDIQPLQ